MSINAIKSIDKPRKSSFNNVEKMGIETPTKGFYICVEFWFPQPQAWKWN